MNLRDRLILEEYRKDEEQLALLDKIVGEKIDGIVAESGVRTFSSQHRVKSEKSLAGKMVRNEGWYDRLTDLTDLVGARIICYFSDDIDRLGELIEKNFVIDWGECSDKRKLIEANSFGYLSMHYIGSLPKSDEYPEELCRWRFEIQIRTMLQHVWSDIEHDLGYKSEFGVPRAVLRGFARVSALLELADDEFVRIRDVMQEHTESVRKSIIEDTAADVPIDMVSLAEYVRHNRRFRALLGKMGEECNAQIEECDPGAYVAQLSWLGIKTIGGLSQLLTDNEVMARRMLVNALQLTDLDILSSSTGLRYLCQAELCRRGMSVDEVAEFLALSLRDARRAERRAKYLLDTYRKLAD